MPVIHIETLPPHGEKKMSSILENVAFKAAEKTGLAKERVQAYATMIEPGNYCFAGETGNICMKDRFHPMVHIYLRDNKTAEFTDMLTEAVAEAVAEEMDIERTNVLVMTERYAERSFYVGGRFL